MTGERSARALARIEAAMRRIELAAQSSGGTVDAGTEQRYQTLWNQANAALGDLDQLIGTLEQ